MESIASKVTVALVGLLLFAATPTTARSEEKPAVGVNDDVAPIDSKGVEKSPLLRPINGGATFQLICRGGPGLRISSTGGWNAWGLDLVMSIDFKASTQPPDSSGRNLQPAQCSPARFSLVKVDPTQIRQQALTVGQVYTSEPLPAVLGAQSYLVDAAVYDDAVKYLKDPNHYWSFMVYDTGDRYFLTTHGEYWKPEFADRVKSLGRVKPPPGTTPATPLPICDAAAKARARNSPAAPGLEAQCRAAGVTPIDKADVSRDKVYKDLKEIDTGSTFTELRCRGGARLRFAVVEGRTNSSGEPTMYVTVYFQPAAQPFGASGRNLRPGQCAFPERIVRADEPSEIVQEIVTFGQTRQQLHGTPVDTSPTAAERYPDAQNVPQYLSDANHYWRFFVRQNAALPFGRFEASNGQYWKSALGKGEVVPIDSRGIEKSPYVLKPAGGGSTFDATQQNDLAARGEAIANADPLSAELRSQQPEGPARRGFDIGMAAAEGNTLPGPGKQKIHDAMSPDEQQGYDTAVAFSLERNRNAEFAATGAAIAEADPVVAAARAAEPDVFYWLGFDIATGIFGDPALGAKGNTATGPGSMRIRNALSAAGQRGFNASVTLHLSRKYKP